MSRNWHDYYMAMAKHVSTMSTCVRRKVGCVLIDDRDRVLATGFNGVPPGWPHCNEGYPCPGSESKSGEDLNLCYANHAEANALLQCQDVWKIKAAYITTSPCITCVKLLLCTSTRMIVFDERYACEREACELWLKHSRAHGRAWAFHPARQMEIMGFQKIIVGELR